MSKSRILNLLNASSSAAKVPDVNHIAEERPEFDNEESYVFIGPLKPKQDIDNKPIDAESTKIPAESKSISTLLFSGETPERNESKLVYVRTVNTKKNYYKILNISENATPAEIKKAYSKAALIYHSDKDGLNKYTQEEKEIRSEKMKELNSAYEVLRDPEKRNKHDISISLSDETLEERINCMIEKFYDLFKKFKQKGSLETQESTDEIQSLSKCFSDFRRALYCSEDDFEQSTLLGRIKGMCLQQQFSNSTFAQYTHMRPSTFIERHATKAWLAGVVVGYGIATYFAVNIGLFAAIYHEALERTIDPKYHWSQFIFSDTLKSLLTTEEAPQEIFCRGLICAIEEHMGRPIQSYNYRS